METIDYKTDQSNIGGVGLSYGHGVPIASYTISYDNDGVEGCRAVREVPVV